MGKLLDEIRSGEVSTRQTNPYDISEEDRAYILETGPFWDKESLSAKVDANALWGLCGARRQRDDNISRERTGAVARRPFLRGV